MPEWGSEKEKKRATAKRIKEHKEGGRKWGGFRGKGATL